MHPTDQQATLRLNYNNRDYEYGDLPRNAQLLLQDIMRLDQQIAQLQFELRHLQAARHVYGSSLGRAINEEESDLDDPVGHAGSDHHEG